MKTNNKNPVLSYPESSLLVAMAETAWAGNLKSVKIEFSLSGRLKTKLIELLGKEIHKIFITDSDVRHIKRRHGQNEEQRDNHSMEKEEIKARLGV